MSSKRLCSVLLVWDTNFGAFQFLGEIAENSFGLMSFVLSQNRLKYYTSNFYTNQMVILICFVSFVGIPIISTAIRRCAHASEMNLQCGHNCYDLEWSF